MVMSPAAPDSFAVIFRFGADAGARAIGATDDAAAVELPGRRRRPPRSNAALTGSFPSTPSVTFAGFLEAMDGILDFWRLVGPGSGPMFCSPKASSTTISTSWF